MVIAKPSPTSENRPPVRSRPYLAVLGSSPLRIQEATPPPDLSVYPPAGAPPHPPPLEPATTLLVASPAPTDSTASPELVPTAPTPTPEPASPAKPVESKPEKVPMPILPDDTRPKIRAEDFLPFFQPPGANQNPNDVSVAPTPPAPGVQPPSSATYRQQ